MLKLAADENLNNNIIRGLLRQNAELDIVRIRDAELSIASDPDVLAWAAGEGRVLVTKDVNTITRYTFERVRSGLSMPWWKQPKTKSGS